MGIVSEKWTTGKKMKSETHKNSVKRISFFLYFMLVTHKPRLSLKIAGRAIGEALAYWVRGLFASLIFMLFRTELCGEMGPGLLCCLVDMLFSGLEWEVPTLSAHMNGQAHFKFL